MATNSAESDTIEELRIINLKDLVLTKIGYLMFVEVCHIMENHVDRRQFSFYKNFHGRRAA